MLIQYLETGSYVHKIYWIEISRKVCYQCVKIIDTQIHIVT
jgi:hypothetical protein